MRNLHLPSIAFCMCLGNSALPQVEIQNYPSRPEPKFDFVFNPYKAEILFFNNNQSGNRGAIGKPGEKPYPGVLVGWRPSTAEPFTFQTDGLYLAGKKVLSPPNGMSFVLVTSPRISSQSLGTVAEESIPRSLASPIYISPDGMSYRAIARGVVGGYKRIAYFDSTKWINIPTPAATPRIGGPSFEVVADWCLREIVVSSQSSSETDRTPPRSAKDIYCYHYKDGKFISKKKSSPERPVMFVRAFTNSSPIWEIQDKSIGWSIAAGESELNGSLSADQWPTISVGGQTKTITPLGTVVNSPKTIFRPNPEENVMSYFQVSNCSLFVGTTMGDYVFPIGDLFNDARADPIEFLRRNTILFSRNAKDQVSFFLMPSTGADSLTVYDPNARSRISLSLNPLRLGSVISASPSTRYILINASSSRRSLIAILDLVDLKMTALDIKEIERIESVNWDGDVRIFMRGYNEKLLIANLKGLSWKSLMK